MLVRSLADDGLDASPEEFLAMPPRTIGSVALQTVGALARSPGLAFDLRNGVCHRQELRDVVDVGGCDFASQGNAVGFGDHVMFTA